MKALASLRLLTALSAALALTRLASGQTAWLGSLSNTNWSTAANWSSGTVPGGLDAVVFNDAGTVTTVSNVNNAVDGGLFGGSIGSLQYANSNNVHTTLIAPGQTLTVAGNLVAGTETAVDISGKTNTITGPGGALVLNNSAANLVVRQGPATGSATANRTTLNLSGLDSFTATVSRVLVGVGTGGGVNRATGRLLLAKTNVITASGSSPAIDVGDSGSNNGGGSSLLLGQTNAILADTLTVNRAKESGSSLSFNAAFANAAAYFRGADGTSRMATFAISDGGSGSGTFGGSGTVDLSGGTVDMLIDTLQVARANSNTGSTTAKTQTGTLTLKAGTLDVNTLQIGINTAANVNWGLGTVNITGPALVVVNTALELGRTAAAASQGGDNTRGVLNINGGTVRANVINANFASTNNTITLTNATLAVTNCSGPGINLLAVTNSTLQLPVSTTAPGLIVTNLSLGGATNKVNISAIPVLAGYPAQFPIIKYTTRSGVTNLGLGALPFNLQPYVAYLSNNFANASVDLVVTAGPAPARSITWTGLPGDWDVANNTNWKDANGVTTIFNQTDFVLFNDTASGTATVNLTTQLDPTTLAVSNNFKNYTFTGSGFLDGPVGVNKQGTGTLVFDNIGQNTFSGGVTVNGGTVQFGNNDSLGNLPALGAVIDNGSLAFKWAFDVTVSNVISGSGTVVQDGTSASTLRLAAANNFSGPLTVASGTLVPQNNAALGATNGATFINNGATLDVSGPSGAAKNSVDLRAEPIVVSGSGVGGNGAIVSYATVDQQNALALVTLAGNTYFGGSGRWDIRSATGKPASLSTGGQPYKIVKLGPNQVSLVGVGTIDPALGDIEVQQGTFAIQTSTTQLGDPTKTITVFAGATLDVYGLTAGPLNKNIILNGDGAANSLFAESGTSTNIGPMTLNGTCVIAARGTLYLNNLISGPGTLYKSDTGTLILGGNTSHSGGTYAATGNLLINGNLNGAVTNNVGTTLAGSGTINGPIDLFGTLNPGNINGAGTLTASAGLTMEVGADMVFDLSATNTAGNGSNDLLEVTGDLVLNGNNITLNPLQGRLQAGTYKLIDYSGNLLGSGFNTFVTIAGNSRFSATLDTSTPHQVKVVISGSSANLKWASTTDSSWDASSYNWVDLATTGPSAFYNGDSVLLDDSVSGATNTLTIGAGVVLVPWALTNNSSLNNYTIAGAGKLSGATSLLKSGTSLLTLSTTNDFSGPVNVLAGTLRVGASAALGSTAAGTTIASGATLDLGAPTLAANALNLGQELITVSGAGVDGNGAIVNSSTNRQFNALQLVTLAGDTTFGGTGVWTTGTTDPGRWDIRGSSVSNCFLNTGSQPFNLIKRGSNHVGLVNVTVDPALANLDIQQGVFALEGDTTGLGNPKSNLVVRAGATLAFYNSTNLWDKVFTFYGDGVNTNLYNWSGNNTLVGPVTLNGDCVFAVPAGTLTNAGALSGSGGLIKNNSGVLVLAGPTSYGGNTVVNGGTLALVEPVSLAGSPNLTLASNASLDVTGRIDDTLTLSGSQVLAGSGTVNGNLVVGAGATVSPGINGLGTLSVSNALTLQGTTVMDLVSPGSSDLIRYATSIQFGGTLQLAFTSGGLHAGDSYKLFSAGSYSGAFTLAPASPGAGLKWNTNLLAVSGILGVEASVNIARTNLSVVVNGSNLQLSWPSDHLGWWLQVQTNAATVGLSNNWVTLPNSSTVTSLSVPLNAANGSVFYRMVYTNAP